jgi:hypothetical protein
MEARAARHPNDYIHGTTYEQQGRQALVALESGALTYRLDRSRVTACLRHRHCALPTY